MIGGRLLREGLFFAFLVFMLAQRAYVSGVTAGAVKN